MNIVNEDKTFLDHSLINDSDADILTFFRITMQKSPMH